MTNHNNTRLNILTYQHLFKSLAKGDPTWRIVLYVRLSKEDRRKGVSESIISQLKWIDFQIEHVLKLDNYMLVDIYIDDGRSGTDFDREDYVRMIHDIDNKFANCILIKDISRYARNLAEGIKELDSFVLEKNIRFICTDTPVFDTLIDPTAISSPEVYQAFQIAESHARDTSRKIRQKQFMLRLEGLPTGGFPPYGFMKHPDPYVKNWIIDEEAITIVRNIFEWSANGFSPRLIAKELNRQGVPNPTAYKKLKNSKYQSPNSKNNSGLWWPQTVSDILNNEVYLGSMIQGKSSSFDHKRHKQKQKPKDEHIKVDNCHEQAVDTAIFEQSCDERKSRTRITKSGTPHIFANVVYCSGCKRALKKDSSTNAKGIKYDYLRCRTAKDLGKEYCTDNSKIRLDELSETILHTIKAQLELIVDLRGTIKKINQNKKMISNSSRIEQLYKKAEDEKMKLDSFLDESWYDYKRGIISEEQFLRIKKENEEKKEMILERMRELLQSQNQLSIGIDYNYQYFNNFLKHKDAETLNRTMVKELIKEIVVHPDKSIDVSFNYQDQYELILDFIEENQKPETKEQVKKRTK